jgi:hypothetical protein
MRVPIPVFDPADCYRLDILRALSEVDLQFPRNWSKFVQLSAASSVGIIAVRRLDEMLLGMIVSLKVAHAETSVIVVTDSDPANTKFLARFRCDAVIWTEEVGSKLESSLTGLIPQTPKERTLVRISRASWIAASQLRAAVVGALEGIPPRTISEFAHVSGLTPHQLRREWARVPNRGSARLQDLLAWLILVRGASMAAEGESWSVCAIQLRVDRSTLHRYAKRLAGTSLGALPSDLDERFTEWCHGIGLFAATSTSARH